ncbi:MAG: MATE family efflux transporter [Christensenellaceae bacterium]|nr:MATE family efflux transporter [Christensenellaceae bacterium]
MQVDMTTGQPLKRMLAFGAPMLMGSALTQLASLADSLIVGRVVGVNAFAAIAAAAPVALLTLGLLMGFCNGFLIPIALCVGAGDRDGADRFACAALMLIALMGVLAAIPSAALANRLVLLFDTPADLAADAVRYLRVALLGMPIPLVNAALWGILRAEGDTRAPLRFQALALGLGLALHAALVVGLGMGVAGAALANLSAQTVSCALCARHMLLRRPGIARLMRFFVRRDMAVKMLRLGAPIALTNLMASLSAAVFQFAVNALGSSAVLAVAVSDRLFALPMMPAMLMGSASEVFGSQNCGANRPDRIRAGVTQLYALMLAFLTPALALAIALHHRFIPMLIGDASPHVLALARSYMLLSALAVPFQCATSILKNVLQGIGLPQKAVIASVYDLLARLMCALFGTAYLGFTAIGLAAPIGWGLSALALLSQYRAALPHTCRTAGRTHDG